MVSLEEGRGRNFTFKGLRPSKTEDLTANLHTLVIAGWAGRDAQAIEAHIRELEEIGVARPRAVPTYYRVSSALLTQDDEIEVAGRDSSGEAEVALLHMADGLWITLGSDHTDRKLEAVGVTMSKQVCAKPFGTTCWKLDDVRAHWDQMKLRSVVHIDGKTEVYQEDALASLRRPEDLLEKYEAAGHPFPVGSVMFCGTVPVHGGLRFADRIDLSLVDPVLNRSLEYSYSVLPLEIAD